MVRYKLEEDVRIEYADPFEGLVQRTFRKGTATPKNEQEERALELLVRTNQAERLTESKTASQEE